MSTTQITGASLVCSHGNHCFCSNTLASLLAITPLSSSQPTCCTRLLCRRWQPCRRVEGHLTRQRSTLAMPSIQMHHTPTSSHWASSAYRRYYMCSMLCVVRIVSVPDHRFSLCEGLVPRWVLLYRQIS